MHVVGNVLNCVRRSLDVSGKTLAAAYIIFLNVHIGHTINA